MEPRYTADGRGMVRRDAGIYVLHLQGSFEEMARQHGELLRAEIRQGVLPFMSTFLERQLGAERDLLSRLVARAAEALLRVLGRVLARNAPRRLLAEFHALAEAAGLSPREADMALAVPESMLNVLAVSNHARQAGLGIPLLRRRRGLFGCSGAVALPEITRSGHLLHARNLDYDGIGTFDRFPTVAICRPTTGQAYLWIASAGVHTAALTSMNESGLFLGSNTSQSMDVSLRGMPFFAVNEAAIRGARTLGEAIDLLGRQRAASGYNVHLSHGPTGEAAVVEYAYSKQRVRLPERGFLAATNHYLDPEMAKTLPRVTLVDTINTRARLARLVDGLETQRGDLTVESLAALVRNTVEHPTGEPRPLGDVVCNYLNLSSAVADVTAGKVWTTADPAPAALGRYVAFDLGAELEAFGEERAYPLEVLEAAPLGADAMQCIEAYKEAHAAHSYRNDIAETYAHLGRARGHREDEPRVALAQALVALKLGRLAEADRHALDYLGLVGDEDPRRYRAHLVRSWCADLRGQRAEAEVHLTRARSQSPGLDDADLELAIWTRRPFTHRDRKQMHVELFNAKRLML